MPNDHTDFVRTRGLVIHRVFSSHEIDPFDQVDWSDRTAEIKDDSGNVIFRQENCKFPRSWSDLACNVTASKYFYGDIAKGRFPSRGGREYGVDQVIARVCKFIAERGDAGGYFNTPDDREIFEAELKALCVNQIGSFNSPVWFNVGLHDSYGLNGSGGNWRWDSEAGTAVPCDDSYKWPQASACFLQSVTDDMGSIMDLARSEAMLFKGGSGTGTNLSSIRSSRETLSGGGKPSGPVSFMRIYDSIAGTIKSGGKTRRAAKMQCLNVSHPDVMEFIRAKSGEERKAKALIDAGYDSGFNGEAYGSVLFQNANLSVRFSDRFMEMPADADWTTTEVSTGKPSVSYKVGKIKEEVAAGAWLCGDPGAMFDDTLQHWHTCPNSGRINTGNPCVEFEFLDDTACNLASVNLMKFRMEGGTFDTLKFRHACRIFLIAQDILVDNASYPTRKIAENSHKFRPLGLGYANLGALIMSLGLPYDSHAGLGLAGAVTAIMQGEAYLTSAEIAEILGPFEGFAANREPMMRVIQQHAEAIYKINICCPGYLREHAFSALAEAKNDGAIYGYRNSQVTVLAPTGTIAFMMDCDTTGIEPDIALVKYKTLAGGGTLKIVNQTVPMALESLGYTDSASEQTVFANGDRRASIGEIVDYINENDTIEKCPGFDPKHLPVFDCAFPVRPDGRSISWTGHVDMMAAAQPFISGAISKTVNMPNQSTPADIWSVYEYAWKIGLKAIAVYRDGCKQSQPLNTKADGKAEPTGDRVSTIKPVRERLPNTRNSITHKFSIGGHEGYLTVGLFPDGRPGELFVTMSKVGSTISGLMDAFATSVSMCLQYGVPLKSLVGKFEYHRYEPAGITHNPDVPFANSFTDYVFRWLGMQFLPWYREANAPVRSDADPVNPVTTPTFTGLADGPPCDTCSFLTVRCGSCYRCPNCGSTTGCG